MAEVSREYAAALFELAKESGREKAFLDALQGIRAQLDAQPEYYALLSSPNLSIRQRQELLEQAFADVPEYVLSFTELLCEKGHIQQLVDTIRESGLPASCFSFEITETVATDYSENLWNAIDLFTSAGIGLCLDDFGSGYANLNSVLKLPFSVIKMDRSLLSDICTDEKAAALYRNTVSVLRNMGYTVVAEGVETLAELELLSSWGVDMIQGFYFSPPVSRSKLLELLLPKTDAAKNCLA